MKISDIATPGLVVLGVAGLAATALVGFAAGTMVTRDPAGARRVLRRAVREASRGLGQATRFAAEAREQFGDLVAEAREEARTDAARPARDGQRAARGQGRRHARRSKADTVAEVVEPADAGAAEEA
jgi:hypothetical protein